MAAKVKYSLPFQICAVARRCTAPSHLLIPGCRFCVDFYLPPGTPILAARSGVATETESRYARSYNNQCFMNRCNYVVIRHADGHESIYAHLAWRSVKVRRGEKIKIGQTIGLSGQTGYATYPHLHFGVYDIDNENIPPTFNASLPPKISWRKFSGQ